MATDAELLRRYVEEHSDAAFADLVRTHLNLVYFAALRQVGDAHRAEEVAQSVFIDLARKAGSLTGRATLTGWLHTSTRFAATKLRRAEISRQRHEQNAATMNSILSESNPTADWDRLRPVVDDAIQQLPERDREAVLLRFFAGKPFAEIGTTLRLSEDAARMRVERALEKLRVFLARRGIESTSAALVVAFANQAEATAPAGLASAISAAAVGNGAIAGVALGTGVLMSTKSTLIVSIVALAAIGSTFLQWDRALHAETQLSAVTLDRDTLRSQLSAEQTRAKLSGSLNEVSTSQQAELDKLRANNLKLQHALTVLQHQKMAGDRGQSPSRIGRDTPMAAAKTIREAIAGGDPQVVADSIVVAAKGEQLLQKAFDGMAPDMKVRYGTPQRLIAELLCATRSNPNSQVLNSWETPGAEGMGATLSGDSDYRTLHTQTQSQDGRVSNGYQVYKNTSDGWQWVVSDGLVLKRLVETGLMNPPSRDRPRQ